MRTIGRHFLTDARQLRSDRSRVVVVEAVTLLADLQSHRHAQAIAVRAVEHPGHPRTIEPGAPGAERVAAALRERLDVAA